MRGQAYQNAALTVIAGLLALAVLDRQGGMTEAAAAHAQPGIVQSGGMSNALEQRKQMIAELRQISARMERIEAKINAGMNVRVTDMPPLRLPPELMRGAQTARPAERPTAAPLTEDVAENQ
jgi:hypothetical protein